MQARALAFLLFLAQVVLAQQPTPIVPNPGDMDLDWDEATAIWYFLTL
jgi:hypothetical protein